MAKVTLPPGICRISGRIDGWIFRHVRGHTFISRAPRKRHDQPTHLQIASRHRFRQATAYARSVADNPAAWAFYTALAGRRKHYAHAVAVGDYLKAPVIDDIALTLYQGHPEDEIIVTATDDAEVVSVTVAIKSMVGTLLERGPARPYDSVWIYDATTKAPSGQPLTIEVTAMDRPGNEVTRTTPWVPPTPAETWDLPSTQRDLPPVAQRAKAAAPPGRVFT